MPGNALAMHIVKLCPKIGDNDVPTVREVGDEIDQDQAAC